VPSLTAARVAAYRLTFERLRVPFGDSAADERLAQDVARSIQFTPSERMARYLRARTAVFDRVLVGALQREVTQVACVGAGYDGRSLRYAKPGARFFEVDHPATQEDKRARLKRLSLDVSQVEFIVTDLNDGGGLDAALLEAGWDPDASSLMLCEGAAIYLETAALGALLEDLRALAGVGTRLAISLPLDATDADHRAQLRTAIAAIGEPARNTLSAHDAISMLTAARWRRVEVSERSSRAGLVVAAPVWEPAAASSPTVSRVGAYLERLYHRRGIDGLGRHLEDAYGIEVSRIRQLDVGTLRIDRRDGPSWVARVFSEQRPLDASHGDAEILRFLERMEFPAERCAHPDPVTSHDGQAVVVTEHAGEKAMQRTRATFGLLGDLLGRLHTLDQLPAGAARPGGGWHHLVFQGTPGDELAACRELLDAAAPRVPSSQRDLYNALLQTVSKADGCEELPGTLIHPDFVPANAITSTASGTTIIDWTGAGQGPRLWSLAFLLWTAGSASLAAVDATILAYQAHVHLEQTELGRLPDAIAARPVILACWGFATGRQRLPDALDTLTKIRADADRIATRARSALAEQL